MGAKKKQIEGKMEKIRITEGKDGIGKYFLQRGIDP
jgi:hypothetical protein